jgi:hypothetical protein
LPTSCKLPCGWSSAAAIFHIARGLTSHPASGDAANRPAYNGYAKPEHSRFLVKSSTTLADLVRQDFPWAAAWRQRLALQNSAVATNLTGRREDESVLRDAQHRPQVIPRAAFDAAGGTVLAHSSLHEMTQT